MKAAARVRDTEMVNEGGSGSGRDVSGSVVPISASAALDAKGVVTAWSEGACRLTGHSADEMVGRSAAGLLAEQLPDAIRRRIDEAADWAAEVPFRHRDGHRVNLRLRAHALQDGHGGTQWFVTATVVPGDGAAMPGTD